MANSQPSTLTSYVDHTLSVEGKGSTTIPFIGVREKNKGGNPEYSNQQKYGSSE